MNGKISEEKVQKLFLDRSSFKMVNEKKWYKKKYFYPKPKYLNVKKADDNSDSKVEVMIDKDILERKKEDRFGPIIAGNYTVTYLLTNEKYGFTKISQKENFHESHTFILDDTSQYLHDTKFQNYLVSRVSNYFSSMGICISSELNFHNLKGITEEQKKDTIQSFESLKPYLKSVNQRYQKIVLNNNSIKFTDNEKNKIRFDIYTDYNLEVNFKPVEDTPLGLSVSNGNAIVTLIFDSDTKQWLIETIDFETYNQNSEEWKDKQVIETDKPHVNQWSVEHSGNIV